MHRYSWIALQLMMADASWYDYDKAESSEGGSSNPDNDGIVWIRTKEDLEKHKKEMQHTKGA